MIAHSVIAPIAGGITAAAGFRAAGVACGIKASGALDLALIASDRVASAAAVFTTNQAVAAPVIVSREHLAASRGRMRAVVANSGCANACTGDAGLRVANLMTAEVARALGCEAEEVLVASTGVIGVALDPRKVTDGIIAASDALGDAAHTEAHAAAARAIMTTDPFPKEYAVRVDVGEGRAFHVGGMAKGSGMIEPMLATMLGFLTCDADVAPAVLQRALAEACDTTFNAITVDGECSTNDSVFLLANGASGVVIGGPDGARAETSGGKVAKKAQSDEHYEALVDALRAVCLELALGIVRGGEGATKLVSINVTGARTYDEAKRAARAIANSLLVKTAIHGADPNWGRLIAVAGRAGVGFSLSGARVVIGSTVLFDQGRPFDERAAEAAQHLQGKDIRIEVNLGTGGPEDATIWTCDLSAEYVRINAEYRT